MEIIVGRKGQQRTPITDPSVSREHCKLTSNMNGTYTIENLSANGTYIDGRSVIRSVVTPDTIIQLGATFKISIKELIPVTPKTANQPAPKQCAADHRQKEYEEKFRRLKHVYDKYSEEKLAIQKEAGMNNFYRMLPMTLLSLVGLGAAAIPGLGNIAPVIGILSTREKTISLRFSIDLSDRYEHWLYSRK